MGVVEPRSIPTVQAHDGRGGRGRADVGRRLLAAALGRGRDDRLDYPSRHGARRLAGVADLHGAALRAAAAAVAGYGVRRVLPRYSGALAALLFVLRAIGPDSGDQTRPAP